MDPELFKEFADEFIRELNRLRGDETRRLAQHQGELARCDSRIKKIVDAIAEGLPPRALKAELEELVPTAQPAGCRGTAGRQVR